MSTTISLNDPAVQTRYAELNKLRKVELIERAKNPAPGHQVIHTAHDMAGWRKDELIMSIIQSERDYGQAPPVATLPATPAKVVLTPNAKHALTTAEMRDGGYWYLNTAWRRMDSVTLELTRLHLVDDMGPGHSAQFVLTENGLRMRTWLKHQTILGHLAKQVRAENITGEDLADLAAGVDAGEETGTITGTSVHFQLSFALAASLSDQSAEDLRTDLETYLGWND